MFSDPVNLTDINGLAVWGVSLGGSIGGAGVSASGSLTIALDSNGSGVILYTPEAGAGTPGTSGFARGVGGSGTVDDILGPGASASGDAFGLSGSVTVPIVRKPGECGFPATIDFGNKIYEFGLGTSGSGISVTVGKGEQLARTEIFGDIGGWIGRNLYDVIHGSGM